MNKTIKNWAVLVVSVCFVSLFNLEAQGPPPPGSCFFQTMGWHVDVTVPYTGIRTFTSVTDSNYSGMSMRFKGPVTGGSWVSLGSTSGHSLNAPVTPGTFEVTMTSLSGCPKVVTFVY